MRIEEIHNINKIKNIDIYTLQKIMTSANITDGEKAQFIKNNSTQIHQIIESKISGKDFSLMMKNRPLIRFRPLKNSYTKRGDKKLLAASLDIEPSSLDAYVDKVNASLNIKNTEIIIDNEDLEKIKNYTYRHGKKEQVLNFLDYELSHAKNILKTLYHTLEYDSGGVADYFFRPIHRLDNNTMVRMYNIIDKNLKIAQNNGQLDNAKMEETARWALVRIYEIQNNQRLINAVKAYRSLS